MGKESIQVNVLPQDLVAKAWPPIMNPHCHMNSDGSVHVHGDAGSSPAILLRAASADDAVAIMTQMVSGKSRVSTAYRTGIAIGKASANLRLEFGTRDPAAVERLASHPGLRDAIRAVEVERDSMAAMKGDPVAQDAAEAMDLLIRILRAGATNG